MRTLPLFLLAACGTVTLDEYEVCALDVTLSAEAGRPGDTIVASGGPFTELRDTRVEVGGYPAEVVAVERVGCEVCDACREDAGCPPCGICTGELLEPDDRATCFGDALADPPVEGACATCSESTSFVVPEGPIGPVTVWIVNRNGTSAYVPFTVLGGDTGGTGGTGATGTTGGTGAAGGSGAIGGTGATGGTGGTGGPATGGTGDTAAATATP